MIINLMEIIRQISNADYWYLAGRDKAQQIFSLALEEKLSDNTEVNRRVIVDCKDIPLATSSFIDELFFIHIFDSNCRHGNSILILKNVSDELYFNLKMAVEGKKGLIEEAKKKNKFFLNIEDLKKYKESHSNVSSCQVGSPYLLCERNGGLEILGFSEGEKQKVLLENIIQGARYTTSLLALKENISNTAAANRLTRLYEKNLVFRQIKPESVPEIYEYFYS